MTMEEKSELYIEWICENFSCWNVELHGTRFSLPNTLLNIYPRGLSGHGVFMTVKFYDPTENSSRFEVCYSDSDGSPIFKQKVPVPDLDSLGNTLLPGPKFEDAVRAVMKKDDILVLKIYSRGRDLFFYERTIINYVDRCIKIPTFICNNSGMERICNFSFNIGDKNTISMSTDLKDSFSDYLQMDFELSPSERIATETKIFIRTCMSLFDSEDILIVSEENKHIFRYENDWAWSWTFSSIAKAKKVAGNSSYYILRVKFIFGDVLHEDSFLRSIQYVKSIPKKPIKSSINAENGINDLKVVLSEDSLVGLSEEMMCLYQDQDFSDITLKCGDVTFPVHKNILGARSPVFKTMLSTDMRDAASSEVDIDDLDPSTLARFLTFLYTGVVEDLEGDSALKLYYAAYKYQVPTLKKECDDYLCDNVSISNVCDVLSLGDKHQDDKVVSVARDFILRNFNAVLSSKEWGNLMKKDSFLTSKTLTHFTLTNCVGRISS